MRWALVLCVGVLGMGCWGTTWAAQEGRGSEVQMAQLETATFAGGCFWCMEAPFEQLEGVASVTSGYTGGTNANPTYEEVSSGATGHAEAVEIRYDPSRITYEKLLEVFWRNIDPTQPDGQFADHGRQYRTAVFFHTPEQRQLAEASKARLQQSGTFKGPIVTEIVPASAFYPAEEYHQDYYKKNPLRYKLYRSGSGREQYLQTMWGRSTH
jgi:methionine-S-sulfoxide reductase